MVKNKAGQCGAKTRQKFRLMQTRPTLCFEFPIFFSFNHSHFSRVYHLVCSFHALRFLLLLCLCCPHAIMRIMHTLHQTQVHYWWQNHSWSSYTWARAHVTLKSLLPIYSLCRASPPLICVRVIHMSKMNIGPKSNPKFDDSENESFSLQALKRTKMYL